jgi:hydrogenase maturation protein HypF
VLRRQVQSGLNAPLTSSMGRLFDAVSALIGVEQVVNYEAQAAIELEALADPQEKGYYPVEVPSPSQLSANAADGVQSLDSLEIDPSPMLRAIVSDLLEGAPIAILAARFHNSLAQAVLQVCQRLRPVFGDLPVALSGGVWQNRTLLRKTLELLDGAGFTVYVHEQVPSNDGGLALGQAAVAARRVAAG